ncbi:hypothetical protein ABIA00_003119 [Bradyrhizobium ottawaense]|uniref:hypothetical protein n=1 Tax=Bradyrhizobium ottawaense TaxID=931866 RepID=UPI00383927B9
MSWIERLPPPSPDTRLLTEHQILAPQGDKGFQQIVTIFMLEIEVERNAQLSADDGELYRILFLRPRRGNPE